MGTIEVMPKITGISLHVGQMVLGQMATSVQIGKFDVEMFLSPVGVDIVSKKRLVKTIPYSNVQGIDYEK